jgi:hypothetical protein
MVDLQIKRDVGPVGPGEAAVQIAEGGDVEVLRVDVDGDVVELALADDVLVTVELEDQSDLVLWDRDFCSSRRRSPRSRCNSILKRINSTSDNEASASRSRSSSGSWAGAATATRVIH